MQKILITGSSGFLGKNLSLYLREYKIFPFSRTLGLEYNILTNNYLDINQIGVVIHLAGKAHDLKNTTNEKEFFKINTDLTKKIFDSFLNSNSNIFIYLSSVKAVKDFTDCILTEEIKETPTSIYGKSKLAAEKYIHSKFEFYKNKSVYILRPCMIHGPGNKGNLNLLYKIVNKGFPWPLGAFNNERSFCSIDNLSFIIKELIDNGKIPSGIYNIADDEALSTNEIINLIAKSQQKNIHILNVSKFLINVLAKLGDLFKLSFNTDRLNKLTENYIVSNKKIKNAINKPLPITAKLGLLNTFDSFNQ